MRVADPDSFRWKEATGSIEAGDVTKALSLFTELDRDGEHYASTEIGHLYEVGGPGLARNYQEAAKWYRKAIFHLDDPFANARLGAMYYNGLGVTKDKKKAFEHLQKGETANQPDALTMLGLYFLLGVDTQPNLERAKVLFLAAANQGFVLAMFYLANTERRGRNYLAALRWRIRATVETFRIGLRYGKADWRLAGLTQG